MKLLHTSQTPSHEAAPETEPGGSVLTRGKIQAEYFSMPFVVYSDGLEQRHLDDAAPFAGFNHQSVSPHIGVRASVKGPVRELVNCLVQFPGQL